MTERFLFTTEMANTASECVRRGEYASIFDWHRKNVNQSTNDENAEPKPEAKVEVSPLMRMQQMADERSVFQQPPAKKAAVDAAATQKKIEKLEEIEMSLAGEFKNNPMTSMNAPFPMGVRPGHPTFRGPYPGPYPPPHMIPMGMGHPGYPPGFGGYPPQHMGPYPPRMNLHSPVPGGFPPGTMNGMPPTSGAMPGMPPNPGMMHPGMPPVSGMMPGMPHMPPTSSGVPPQMPPSSQAMPQFPYMPNGMGMMPPGGPHSAAQSPAMPPNASPFFGPHSVPASAGMTNSPAFPPSVPSRPHSTTAAMPQFPYPGPGHPGQPPHSTTAAMPQFPYPGPGHHGQPPQYSPAFNGGMMPPNGMMPPHMMRPPFPS